jgi:hypothetical protein
VSDSLKEVLAWLAAIGISATALSGIALGLFHLFGQKWLESKFDQQLEKYKHAQQKELEKLRLEINTQFDRVTKLHQHEFDILPTLWARLHDAFGQTAHFVSPFQSYPDLNRMTAEHLESFLSKSELEDWQKGELANTHDKTNAYIEAIFWHRLRDVKKSYFSFHNYFISNGIFIQPNLKQSLLTFSDMLHEAILEKEFDQQHPSPGPDRFKKSDRVRKEGPEMLKRIERDVYAKLWNDPTLSS